MTTSRVITVLLLGLLALVHGALWFGSNGTPRVRELSAQVADQQARNAAARVRNAQLAAELKDLTDGLENIEESARHGLGMVKPDEILVQYPQMPRTH